MQPRMSGKELDLFLAFVRNSDKYIEFGTGGSTFIASSYVKSWIISVDSSREWLEKVDLSCSKQTTRPDLRFVDIGRTGEWGYPLDPGTKDQWTEYHSGLWSTVKTMDADLYLVDGRFRVACFAQIVAHCSSQAIIGFHDFTSRHHYYTVREIAREIAVAEDMSFFQPLPQAREKALEIINYFKFDPA